MVLDGLFTANMVLRFEYSNVEESADASTVAFRQLTSWSGVGTVMLTREADVASVGGEINAGPCDAAVARPHNLGLARSRHKAIL